jgi:hypothetical protein
LKSKLAALLFKLRFSLPNSPTSKASARPLTPNPFVSLPNTQPRPHQHKQSSLSTLLNVNTSDTNRQDEERNHPRRRRIHRLCYRSDFQPPILWCKSPFLALMSSLYVSLDSMNVLNCRNGSMASSRGYQLQLVSSNPALSPDLSVEAVLGVRDATMVTPRESINLEKLAESLRFPQELGGSSGEPVTSWPEILSPGVSGSFPNCSCKTSVPSWSSPAGIAPHKAVIASCTEASQLPEHAIDISKLFWTFQSIFRTSTNILSSKHVSTTCSDWPHPSDALPPMLPACARTSTSDMVFVTALTQLVVPMSPAV